MRAQQPASYTIGQAIGFVAGPAFFTIVLTYAIALLHHSTPRPLIPLCIAVAIMLIGWLLRRWLE